MTGSFVSLISRTNLRDERDKLKCMGTTDQEEGLDISGKGPMGLILTANEVPSLAEGGV